MTIKSQFFCPRPVVSLRYLDDFKRSGPSLENWNVGKNAEISLFEYPFLLEIFTLASLELNKSNFLNKIMKMFQNFTFSQFFPSLTLLP